MAGTEITKTTPAYNPADANTLDGLNNLLQEKIFLNLQKVLPGIVQTYNRVKNRAVIKPAITGVASRGQKIPKEALIDIPVFSMSGGGIIMSFPVKAGDKGWLVANDRNISIFKQNLEESAPNDYRKHCFNDAFFLPDKINDLQISEEDEGAIVIMTEDGSTKFTLKQGKITLTAENIIHNGNTTINGTLTTTNTITAPEAVINGIAQSTHVHGGVEAGVGKTGAPE